MPTGNWAGARTIKYFKKITDFKSLKGILMQI